MVSRRKFIKRGALFVPFIFAPKLLRAGPPFTHPSFWKPRPAGGGVGGPALVANVAAGTAINGGTTGSINTTGANLIVVGVSDYRVSGFPTVSDNKSNSYTSLTPSDDGVTCRATLFYVASPTVGSGHTFTVAGTGIYASIFVAAFSGMAGSPFDVENGNATASPWDTLATGSVTPSQAASVVASVISWNIVPDSGSMSVGSSYIITDQLQTSNGNYLGGAFAYKILSSASAQNPVWDYSETPPSGAAAIAAFDAA